METLIKEKQEAILNSLKVKQIELKKRKKDQQTNGRARTRTNSLHHRSSDFSSKSTIDDSKIGGDGSSPSAASGRPFTPMEKELLELNFDDCHSGFVCDDSVGYITSSPQFFWYCNESVCYCKNTIIITT